jgi:hypothetical protein
LLNIDNPNIDYELVLFILKELKRSNTKFEDYPYIRELIKDYER